MPPTSTSSRRAPWALAKDPANADRLERVLFDVADAHACDRRAADPVMPDSCAEILRRMSVSRDAGTALRLRPRHAMAHDGERAIIKGGRAACAPAQSTTRRDQGA